MLRNDNNLALEIVHKKMQEAYEILKYLSTEFDFHYIITYTLFDATTKRKLEYGGYINDEIQSFTMIPMMQEISNFYHGRLQIEQAIAMGKIVVVCINDQDKPSDIKDWPKFNQVYIVDEVLPGETKTNSLYKIQGLDPGENYQGYRSERFHQLFNDYNSN